jgi:acyl dehydratase
VTPTVFDDLAALLAAPPLDLGASGWVVVEPAMAGAFAAATLAPWPSGGVAPTLLLSLTNRLLPELLQVPAAATGVNYGAASVRFGPTVAVGSKVRISATLIEAVEVSGGVQTAVRITVESDSGQEPPCEVVSLSRWLR